MQLADKFNDFPFQLQRTVFKTFWTCCWVWLSFLKSGTVCETFLRKQVENSSKCANTTSETLKTHTVPARGFTPTVSFNVTSSRARGIWVTVCVANTFCLTWFAGVSKTGWGYHPSIWHPSPKHFCFAPRAGKSTVRLETTRKKLSKNLKFDNSWSFWSCWLRHC